MAEPINPPEIDSSNYVRTRSNLLVPPDYADVNRWQPSGTRDRPGPILTSILDRNGFGLGELENQTFQPGHIVRRNQDYGFLELPPKGSGLDDLLSTHIADGTVGNVGISPVVCAQLSAVLNRQISQAQTAEVTLNGRKSPVRKARDAIAWYDDSPLGFSRAISKIIYQMRVFNRGAPHATIPLTFRVEDWATYGIEPVVLSEDRKLYYLTVDWSKMGVPIPFLPDPLDLEPTGDREWPYWFRKKLSANDKGHSWILLHQTQILEMIPGESWQPGIGTCSVYMFWEMLCDLALEKIRRAEKQIHEPTHGLLTVDGVTTSATDLKRSIYKDKIERDSQGRKVDKGLTVITGRDAIHAAFLNFRESFADYVDFKQALEDVLAQVFNESLSSIVTRKGIGYSAQTNASVQGSADAGVTSILTHISMTLGAMYPRAKIFVMRPNDATKIRTMENFNTFAQAVGHLPDGTLTQAEVRALIHSMIVEIPQTGDASTASANANEDQSDDNDPNGGGDDNNGGPDSNTEEDSALMYEAAQLAPIRPTGTATGRKPQAQRRKDDPDLHARWDREFPDLDRMTQAQIKRKREDTAAWLWVDGALEYQRGDQVVTRDQALDLREEVRIIRRVDADDLAADLANGQITLQQWLDGIQDAVEGAYVTQGILGRGGADQLTDDDTEWLDEVLADPFVELESLARRIREGLYSEAQIANMTRNTISGSVTGYEGMNAVAWGARTARDLPAYPGQGSECKSNCHCYWVFRRGDNGDLLATWTHPPLSRRIPGVEPCRTCERRIKEWSDLVVETTVRQQAIPIRDQVRDLVNAGERAGRIARRLNVTEQRVRNLQTQLRKNGEIGYTRQRGRVPVKQAT